MAGLSLSIIISKLTFIITLLANDNDNERINNDDDNEPQYV
jgi:hypothetical protein